MIELHLLDFEKLLTSLVEQSQSPSATVFRNFDKELKRVERERERVIEGERERESCCLFGKQTVRFKRSYLLCYDEFFVKYIFQ